MKTLHLLRKVMPITLIALGLGGLTTSAVQAQGTPFFAEDFNTPSASVTAINVYEAANSFDQVAFTYSGTGEVRKSFTSDGFYAGATGSGNIFLNYGKTLIISEIVTTNTSNISLSFGLYINKVPVGLTTDLKVEFSTNGTTFTDMPYTVQARSGWQYVTVSALLPKNQANVRLRFTNNSAATFQYRIDDIISLKDVCDFSAPTILFNNSSANGQSFCTGGGIVLTSTIPAGCSWIWKEVNGTDPNNYLALPGTATGNVSGSNGTASNQDISVSITGETTDKAYYLEVSKAQCALSDEIALVAQSVPVVTIGYNAGGVCAPNFAQAIDATVAGAPASPKYQWFYRAHGTTVSDFGAIAGETSEDLTAGKINTAGIYALQVRNNLNCGAPFTNSNGLKIYGTPQTPSVNATTLNFTAYACATDGHMLNTTERTALDGGVVSYDWQKNGATAADPADGEGQNTIAFNALVNGVYRVVVTVNGCASAPSNTATITVAQNPTATAVFSESGSPVTTSCEGDLVTLTAATPNDGNADGDNDDALTYDFFNSTDLNRLNAANSSAAYVLNQNGVTVEDGDIYDIVITNTETSCTSTITTVAFPVEAAPTQYTIGSLTGDTQVFSTPTTLTFCGVDNDNMVAVNNGSAIDDASPFSIQWFKKNGSLYTELTDEDGSPIVDVNATNPDGSKIYTSGTYRLKIGITNGCQQYIDKQVISNSIPAPAFAYSFDASPASLDPICFNTPATITAGTLDPNYSYTWKNGDNSPLSNGTASTNQVSLKYGTGAIVNPSGSTTVNYIVAIKDTRVSACAAIPFTTGTVTINQTPVEPTFTIPTNKNATFNSIGATNINYYWANNTAAGTSGKTDVLNLNSSNALLAITGAGTAASTINLFLNNNDVTPIAASAVANGLGNYTVNLNALNNLFASSSATASTIYPVKVKATLANGCTSTLSTAKNIVVFNISPSSGTNNVSVCGKAGSINANQNYAYGNFASTPPSLTLTLGKCAPSGTTLGRSSEEELETIAAEVAVAQGVVAYPNPFKDQLNIRFFVAQADSKVDVMITDMLGRIVMLYAPQTYTAGVQTVTWDGLAANGTKLPQGLYNVRVAVGNDISSTNVLLNE